MKWSNGSNRPRQILCWEETTSNTNCYRKNSTNYWAKRRECGGNAQDPNGYKQGIGTPDTFTAVPPREEEETEYSS